MNPTRVAFFSLILMLVSGCGLDTKYIFAMPEERAQRASEDAREKTALQALEGCRTNNIDSDYRDSEAVSEAKRLCAGSVRERLAAEHADRQEQQRQEREQAEKARFEAQERTRADREAYLRSNPEARRRAEAEERWAAQNAVRDTGWHVAFYGSSFAPCVPLAQFVPGGGSTPELAFASIKQHDAAAWM